MESKGDNLTDVYKPDEHHQVMEISGLSFLVPDRPLAAFKGMIGVTGLGLNPDRVFKDLDPIGLTVYLKVQLRQFVHGDALKEVLKTAQKSARNNYWEGLFSYPIFPQTFAD